MKKTFRERVNNAREAFFEKEQFLPGQIAVRENDYDLQNQDGRDIETGSFNLWSTAKYILFFVPGVALMYFVTLILAELLIVRTESITHFTGAFFWLGFGTFLMMFGIGKLADLKYLKVTGSVLLASLAIASAFLFVPIESKGNFFGIYSFYFLPVISFVAYLVKKRIDKETIEVL